MKKLATLFKQGDLHLPPNKLIKADDFSVLLEALDIVPLVQKDAKEYKEQVVREVELIKEQAALQGFSEGVAQWADQLAYLEGEAVKIKKNFEERLIPIAIAIAKKVVGKEIEDQEGAVAIVMNTLKSVTLHKRITVYVHRDDVPLMEANKEKMKAMFEELEVFSFQERPDIEQGGCIVETEAGIIDGRLHIIWESVEESFTKILLEQKNKEQALGAPKEEAAESVSTNDMPSTAEETEEDANDDS
jgi:type III secretion protein L